MVHRDISQVEDGDLHWLYEAQNLGFVLTCPCALYARFGGLCLSMGRMKHEPDFSSRALCPPLTYRLPSACTAWTMMPSTEQIPRTTPHRRARARKSAAASVPAATSGIAPAPSIANQRVFCGGTTVITAHLNTVFSAASSLAARCGHAPRDGTNVISRTSAI